MQQAINMNGESEFLMALQRDLQIEALRLELARLDLSSLHLPTGVFTAAQLFTQAGTFLVRDGDHFYCQAHPALHPTDQPFGIHEVLGHCCIMHLVHEKLRKTAAKQLGHAAADLRKAEEIVARDHRRGITTALAIATDLVQHARSLPESLYPFYCLEGVPTEAIKATLSATLPRVKAMVKRKALIPWLHTESLAESAMSTSIVPSWFSSSPPSFVVRAPQWTCRRASATAAPHRSTQRRARHCCPGTFSAQKKSLLLPP